MVLLLAGNLEMWGEIYVIWSVSGILSDREHSQIGFILQKKSIFLYECATCSELHLMHVSTMIYFDKFV